MKLFTTCPTCSPETHELFNINFNPNNDGVYDITCPNGHKFKINILYHHFQLLFENALNALSDEYYIEALSSFCSCYERFMEFFLRIVLKSRGISTSTFNKTWKKNVKFSERQLGAFVMVYLKELGVPPSLLKEENIKLRNDVIHKGYFPTMEECIRYGDNVLEFIRPIIKLLSEKEDFRKEMSKIDSEGLNSNNDIRVHYLPYGLFATNRGFDKTDEKLVVDFLIDILEEKNDEKNEEIIKKIRPLIKKSPKLPEPNKSIIEDVITKEILVELYNFRYYNSGESDINILIKKYCWKANEVEKIINHLEILDWIRKYNIDGKYSLTGIGSMECEKRKLIRSDLSEKNISERVGLLKFIFRNKSNKINYKYSHLDLANDFGKNINEIGVFIADIKEKGYVTRFYRLTEEGEEFISKL